MTGKALWYRSAAAAGVALMAAFLVIGDVGAPERVETSERVPEPRSGVEASDPAAEGIKVHGHWTIEVREPDGELVTRREFENALTASGGQLLVKLLSRQVSQGNWVIHLARDPMGGEDPCPSSPSGVCVIAESHLSCTSDFQFCTLTVGVDPTDTRLLLLSGSATARADGRIGAVRTFGAACDASDSPTSCAVGSPTSGFAFTATDIDPIDVLAGQQILVTVRISFS